MRTYNHYLYIYTLPITKDFTGGRKDVCQGKLLQCSYATEYNDSRDNLVMEEYALYSKGTQQGSTGKITTSTTDNLRGICNLQKKERPFKALCLQIALAQSVCEKKTSHLCPDIFKQIVHTNILFYNCHK